MKAPEFPTDEEDRIAALRALQVLDSAPEDRFDRLTRLARHIGQTPTALVSLVDTNRQWFKSRTGLDAAETPRDISFCGHAILRSEPFIIEDASRDERFADNPLVTGAPHIRFYAGFPLRLDNGFRIGTLCILGPAPKALSADQVAGLRELASCVVAELQQRDAREAAHLLYEQGERLRLILESADIGIHSVNTDGIILSFNKGAERLFGYHESELVGLATPRVLHVAEEVVADAAALSAEAGETIAPGFDQFARRAGRGPYKREWTLVRKDGSRFPGEVTTSTLRNPDGSLRGLMSVITDITERKDAERIKNEFIATVSHELRTPLTSIRGALGLVLGKFGADMPEKVVRLLDTANRNSERLNLLINDILDLEKLDAGKMEFCMAPCDLAELSRQALVANAGYAQQHDVRLAAGDLPAQAMVMADSHRLQQVFANLISNAVKYSPRQEEVTVSVVADGHGWRVSVRDRGAGIPEAFRARVFERFAQAENSDAREKGGTGLGLAISHAIITRHGGSMDFESQPGKGTIFHFALPAATTTPGAAP